MASLPHARTNDDGTNDDGTNDDGTNGGRQDPAAAAPEHDQDDQQPGPGPEVERREPDSPTDLPKRSWRHVLRGSAREFRRDQLTDRAAALTYYTVLSLFPALLVLVSLLGLAGHRTTDAVLRNIRTLAPGAARSVLTDAVQQLQGHAGAGSAVAVVGLAVSLWSASGYVAAFIRAANIVYDMPEGRPAWQVLPVRVGVTVALLLGAVAAALIVVFTGGLADRAGTALGIGHAALTAWSIAKWPVLAVVVALMVALLYWACPNAKVNGFRWITPGSVVALLIWLAASGGFALYVADFASYNRTYGSLAGVVVFLVWLWITNLALLLGLEFDAEVVRQRAVAGGYPPDAEPYAEPRSTRAWSEEDRRRLDRA